GFTAEVVFLQNVVDRFEGVFPLDTGGAGALSPPAGEDAVAGAKEKGESENPACREDHEGAGGEAATDEGEEGADGSGAEAEEVGEDQHARKAVGKQVGCR